MIHNKLLNKRPSLRAEFISITKPGIIFGNTVTLMGGFFMGSQGSMNFLLLLAAIVGMALVIAAGCIFNNYIDRDIDRLMKRTQDRVLAQDRMPVIMAMIYGAVLGTLGFVTLYLFTNVLTVMVALVGLIFYVPVYSLYLKRKSIYGTLVGGVAGAIPPVVGYAAVTDRFDLGALLLFLILFLWQVPHFYAITIYRLNDYKNACIPVLPVVNHNITYTKWSMLVYACAFALAAILPSLLHYTGMVYFIVALALSLTWVGLIIKGFRAKNNSLWARRVFLFSIIVITVLSMMMAVKI